MQISELHTCVCVCYCAEMSYTTQHRTVRIIFPPSLQTIITAQTLFIREERVISAERSKDHGFQMHKKYW